VDLDREGARVNPSASQAEAMQTRASAARRRSQQLVALGSASRDRWLHTMSECLLVRDRIEQTTYFGGRRNPVLDRSLTTSRRRYTRLVGRDSVIDEGKQVLMHRVGCSPDDAFALLRHISQQRNVKLAVVAREVVESTAPRGVGEAGQAG
jgi:hypothetical protein